MFGGQPIISIPDSPRTDVLYRYKLLSSQFPRRSRRCTTRRGGGSSPSWGPTRSATRPSSPARPPEVRTTKEGLHHWFMLRKTRYLVLLLGCENLFLLSLIAFLQLHSEKFRVRTLLNLLYADTEEGVCLSLKLEIVPLFVGPCNNFCATRPTTYHGLHFGAVERSR